jgi:hypothetical protein
MVVRTMDFKPPITITITITIHTSSILYEKDKTW